MNTLHSERKKMTINTKSFYVMLKLLHIFGSFCLAMYRSDNFKMQNLKKKKYQYFMQISIE